MGVEIEKAFTTAAKETHAALKRANENFQQRNASAQTQQATQEATVVCPNCGAKNVSDAIFCHNCGKRMAPESGTA
jgi:membrane protease subunit (stomatin/prohibitin family)